MMRNQQAAVYYVGFKLELTKQEKVIAWADSVILKEDEPHHNYIELSVAGIEQSDQVLSILYKLKEPYDYFESLRLFIPTLLIEIRENRISPDQAAKKTYDYVRNKFYEIPDDFFPFVSYDDSFEMAKDGTYGYLEQVEQSYIDFLKSFSE